MINPLNQKKLDKHFPKWPALHLALCLQPCSKKTGEFIANTDAFKDRTHYSKGKEGNVRKKIKKTPSWVLQFKVGDNWKQTMEFQK